MQMGDQTRKINENSSVLHTMSHIERARVIKSDSNLFTIDTSYGTLTCSARKKITLNSKPRGGIKSPFLRKKEAQNSAIIAGDIVSVIKDDNNEWIISGVLPRTNSLIRPQVSNIDQIVVVLAHIPKPDYLLIDKLLINAGKQGIPVVLCLNKSDIASPILEELKAQYHNIADNIVTTSAKTDDISTLKSILSGKLSCFAGQSAVGKSSLVNALFKKDLQKTDTVSLKLGRGKNTTTRAEIMKLSENTYIIDTPGFSMLDIHGIDKDALDLYYTEYVEVAHHCKYHRCTHTVEPHCHVKTLVEQGILNAARYSRYVSMQNEYKANLRR